MIENVMGLIGWSNRLPAEMGVVTVLLVPTGLIVSMALRSVVGRPDCVVKLKTTGTLSALSVTEAPALFVNDSGWLALIKWKPANWISVAWATEPISNATSTAEARTTAGQIIRVKGHIIRFSKLMMITLFRRCRRDSVKLVIRRGPLLSKSRSPAGKRYSQRANQSLTDFGHKGASSHGRSIRMTPPANYIENRLFRRRCMPLKEFGRALGRS